MPGAVSRMAAKVGKTADTYPIPGLRSERQDFLSQWIEIEPPSLNIGDVAQVRSLGRAMTDEDVAVRPLSRPNALEEISDMIEGQGIRPWPLFSIYDDGLSASAFGVKLEVPAIDQKPSFGSADLDGSTGDPRGECCLESCGEFRRIFEQYVDGIGRRTAVLVCINPAGGGG